MSRQSPSKRRVPAGTLESGRLHLALSDASFVELERAFLTHQKAWLDAARSAGERLSIRRRTAEDIVLGAYGRKCTWTEFSRALRRSRRLGYANAGRRAHVACLLALSLKAFPAQSSHARRSLDEAERHLLHLRKASPVRKEYLAEIRRIRRLGGWPPA
jgi:hypothetical protein